jgi:dCTP deaminase
MILSDGELQKMIDEGKLIVKDPNLDLHIGPASVDCHLGSNFLIIEDREMSLITLDTSIKYREVEADTIIIPPHTFLLATTQEYIKLPADIAAFAEGRSSIGRMGLFIQNAGWIDPGFEGRVTLELYNANSLPIKLEAGRRICQMVFCKMDKPVLKPYEGKYKGQEKTVGSRVFKDKEVDPAKVA